MKSFSFPRSSRNSRLLGAIGLVALIACESGGVEPLTPRLPAETPSSTKTRIVGLVGTLSGPDQWRGDDAFEGADLAVNELNRALPPNKPTYELVTLDDHGDPGEATRLVQQLAGSTRTVGIVYAGPPQGLPPAEPALAAAGIPAILCYGDLYTVRQLSRHVFQASPAFLWEARRIARYLLGDRGYSKIGLVSANDLSGQAARRALTQGLQEAGASLTAAASYAAASKDVGQALATMRRRRVEAIVVEAGPPAAAELLSRLEETGASYRSTAAAAAGARRGRRWAPQIVGLDPLIAQTSGTAGLPAGTVAADSYARGVHYLPVPSFIRFRTSFEAWWEESPIGWEQRAYDAVRMIGWAVRRAKGEPTDEDLAVDLEKLRHQRFAGLDITFGPDDHTAVDQTAVGLWVVPRRGIRVYERAALPGSMPWVPLGRGFSIDGERTDIASRDWRFLFESAPPKKAPAPRIARSLFGVTTPARDPVH